MYGRFTHAPTIPICRAIDLREVRQLFAPFGVARGREHYVGILSGRFVLRQRHGGGDALAKSGRQPFKAAGRRKNAA